MSAEDSIQSPDGRRLSPDEVRDLDEVREAISELTNADLGRLMIAAKTLLGGFRNDPQQRDHQDLLSTAVLLTLSGKRQWRKQTALERHLFRVMRSVASHWRREVSGKHDVLSLSDLESLEDHLDYPDPRPNPERALIIRETLQAIYAHFENDAETMLVLKFMAKGLSGARIRYLTGMSVKQLATIMKRIRRYARRGEYDGV